MAGFVEIAGVPRVGNVAVAAIGQQVGDFEDFAGMAAEALFQLGQVVVVHGQQVVEIGQILRAHASAHKAAAVDAFVGKDFQAAAVHAFAIVPAGRARTGGVHRQAAGGSHAAAEIFGHRRATDVAQANE